MKIENVPQDHSSTYGDMKKAIYAKSGDGKIKSVGSSGWDAEEVVTKQAIDELDENAKEAYEEVKSGKKSPLYYHMYEARMDLAVLSQSTGFFKWTIKRDFRPEVFKKMSEKRLSVYCEALGKNKQEIKELPKANDE
jgi:CRISPR/Cas system-associated protein Cas10 (large subunit of type III CRISPR-Cas system)